MAKERDTLDSVIDAYCRARGCKIDESAFCTLLQHYCWAIVPPSQQKADAATRALLLIHTGWHLFATNIGVRRFIEEAFDNFFLDIGSCAPDVLGKLRCDRRGANERLDEEELKIMDELLPAITRPLEQLRSVAQASPSYLTTEEPATVADRVSVVPGHALVGGHVQASAQFGYLNHIVIEGELPSSVLLEGIARDE